MFHREFSRRFHNIARVAKRKLDAMAGGNAMQHIRLDDSGVIKEVEWNGFHLVREREHIKGSQYMVTFEKSR